MDEESEEWYRLIEIDPESSLEDLHHCIQRAINFDDDHLYEFFVANSVGSTKKLRFDGENGGLWDYDVSDFFPLPKDKKFFYLFDYGYSWYFRIIKQRNKPTNKIAGVVYPRIVETVGENPEQYPEYEEL